jgi:hypothetical protein
MKFLIPIFILFTATVPLKADILSTSEIEMIIPHIEDNALVFFNIAEVLTDTETSLGSSPWRRYIRSRVNATTHDLITLHVFKNVPSKSVDTKIPTLIKELQEKGITVMAFTSRGRNEWYSSMVDNVDLITERVLATLGLQFSLTALPEELKILEDSFSESYHKGIIYSGNTLEKSDLLGSILVQSNYHPSKIIFVDDKIDSLTGVEESLNTLGIPFVGIAYNKTKIDHQNFDPMVATIQLEWLMFHEKLLSDEEAVQIKEEQFSGVDPEAYFQSLMERISL